MPSFPKTMMMVIGGLAAVAALAILVGLIVQALWNALMPEIFGLPEVSYWQGVGLLILGHLLFGGGFHHERHIRRRKACPPASPREVKSPETASV